MYLSAVHIEPPVADEILLVKQSSVGAQEVILKVHKCKCTFCTVSWWGVLWVRNVECVTFCDMEHFVAGALCVSFVARDVVVGRMFCGGTFCGGTFCG